LLSVHPAPLGEISSKGIKVALVQHL
jgi:hypothetical protein